MPDISCKECGSFLFLCDTDNDGKWLVTCANEDCIVNERREKHVEKNRKANIQNHLKNELPIINGLTESEQIQVNILSHFDTIYDAQRMSIKVDN